jgi:hypothetical protein
MLGTSVVTATRPNDTGDGMVAMEARTLDGRVVGAAEGGSPVPSQWKNRDPFAIRSMAQTRAISRAGAPLGQIFVLAGYEATPAEKCRPATTSHDEAHDRARDRSPTRSNRLTSSTRDRHAHRHAQTDGLEHQLERTLP